MRFFYISPNIRRTRIGILCLLVHLGGTNALAQERKDTVTHIQEVTISAPIKKKASTIPVQQLSGKELKQLSVYSVADALRYFSGVQIKDYGGIGGLKTVNVRSLGTNHTGYSIMECNWETLRMAKSTWDASRWTIWRQ